MDRPRIIVAAVKQDVKNSLKQLLVRGGYKVIAEADDGLQALRSARSLTPDLVLAEVDLPGINGFELGRALFADRIAPVLLVSQETFFFTQYELEKARTLQMPFGYVTKPFSESSLFPAVESTLCYYQYVRDMQVEFRNLQNKMEARKVVEQAKGILMQQLGLPEAEAYRRIQKQSMDKCLTMRKVAEAIILTYELKD
jgi:AmiR/NasT family two-component response regulator